MVLSALDPLISGFAGAAVGFASLADAMEMQASESQKARRLRMVVQPPTAEVRRCHGLSFGWERKYQINVGKPPRTAKPSSAPRRSALPPSALMAKIPKATTCRL